MATQQSKTIKFINGLLSGKNLIIVSSRDYGLIKKHLGLLNISFVEQKGRLYLSNGSCLVKTPAKKTGMIQKGSIKELNPRVSEHKGLTSETSGGK